MDGEFNLRNRVLVENIKRKKNSERQCLLSVEQTHRMLIVKI